MIRVVKLTDKGLEKFKTLFSNIGGKEMRFVTTGCPEWYSGVLGEEEKEYLEGKMNDSNTYKPNMKLDCNVCNLLFPKTVEGNLCPCDVYADGYLKKRVREIIRFNEKLRKDGKA